MQNNQKQNHIHNTTLTHNDKSSFLKRQALPELSLVSWNLPLLKIWLISRISLLERDARISIRHASSVPAPCQNWTFQPNSSCRKLSAFPSYSSHYPPILLLGSQSQMCIQQPVFLYLCRSHDQIYLHGLSELIRIIMCGWHHHG